MGPQHNMPQAGHVATLNQCYTRRGCGTEASNRMLNQRNKPLPNRPNHLAKLDAKFITNMVCQPQKRPRSGLDLDVSRLASFHTGSSKPLTHTHTPSREQGGSISGFYLQELNTILLWHSLLERIMQRETPQHRRVAVPLRHRVTGNAISSTRFALQVKGTS